MTLRVLVVDDWKDSEAVLERLLEAWGHEVRSASDGVAALNIADTFQPEVVILKTGTLRTDGYEVARRLRANFGEKLSIIYLSGYDTPEDRQQCEEAGCNHQFLKTANLDQLRRLLEAESGSLLMCPTCKQPTQHHSRGKGQDAKGEFERLECARCATQTFVHAGQTSDSSTH